ncbi:hypothetical protein [Sphingobium subterraneum]|uniref:Uncharacterized protein n=1 Tax=Sphingobium subterraneum TaxID=627688 RepID=A0A841IXY5_9SPHN|nr:hypothetical protein [Sphingobium subterraneum]MBB6123244.1 hypothetical protein [Sphingobium subterraneum]
MSISAAQAVTAPSRPMGRQSVCAPCGATYHARRSTSRYCSAGCRKRASRGNDCYAFNLGALRNALHLLGFAGPIRQGSSQWGLTVPRSHALAEVNRRWPPALSDEDFVACLKALDIVGYDESGSACMARNTTVKQARSKRRLA